MPEPIYILCCQSGADDARTAIASHFNVIDRVELTPMDVDDLDKGVPATVVLTPLRAVAVWRGIEESDFDGEFEFEIKGVFPGGREISLLPSSNRFRFQREKPRHRLTIELPPPLFETAQESGTFLLECRIRKEGSADWLTQRYPIDLVVHPKKSGTSAASESVSQPSNAGASLDSSRITRDNESSGRHSAEASSAGP
jgi:hypothetical protein